MANIPGPKPYDLRLMQELPGGVALFDEDGELVEGNPAFAAALSACPFPEMEFSALFGQAASHFTDGCRTDAVKLGDCHYAVSTRSVSGWDWLCQLQDVSAWVSAQVSAQECVE